MTKFSINYKEINNFGRGYSPQDPPPTATCLESSFSKKVTKEGVPSMKFKMPWQALNLQTTVNRQRHLTKFQSGI